MDLPPAAVRRIAEDEVAWLTTVTDGGAPAPNPVWFVLDGDDLVVFTEPTSRKVHNIEQRPLVCLHFNSDAGGGDIVIINGRAELGHGQRPSDLPAYVAKYSKAITEVLRSTVEAYDRTYDTQVRIRPTRVRLTPG
ncbi:MAG: pyridoxamine 5'-phosphate oxidase family protein [Acidimicrobiia bacterium]